MVKRTLALMCVILFVICSAAVISRAENGEDPLFDLRAFGLLDGIELSGRDGDWFTRGELSRMITNMMDVSPENPGLGGEYAFSDISKSPYAGSINMLWDMGIISGTGGAKYNPDDKARVSEALKMLVNILGYRAAAADGSLEAYHAAAAKIGLLRGLQSAQEYLNSRAVLVLWGNALDIEILSDSTFARDGAYRFKKGDAYRDLLMNKREYTVQKLRGVVTADAETYLNTKITALRKNQLEIDGKIYHFEGNAPLGAAGLLIEFYQRLYADDSQEVYIWRAARQNAVREFKSADIDGAQSGRIRWLGGGGLSLGKDARYLYNGRMDSGWDAEKIAGLRNHSFRAIDNDGDGSADVVFIWGYQNRIVERVNINDAVVYFKSDARYPQKYIALDGEDDEHFVSIADSRGNAMSLEDIEPDMVISYAVSKDGEAIKAVLSSGVAQGVLSEFSEDEITVDGNSYLYDLNAADLRAGETVKIYLNFEELAVYADTDETRQYGYVYAIKQGERIGETPSVKLLIPGPVSVKYLENEDLTGGESAKTPKLFARNDSVGIFKLAQKVKIDGTAVSFTELAARLENKMVSYTLSADGRITAFDRLTPLGSAKTKTYNANELTFARSDGTAFGITQNETRAVCVPIKSDDSDDDSDKESPIDLDASDDDLRVFTELFHNGSYGVTGYEVDNATHIAGVIVVMSAAMKADRPREVNTSSPVAMVESVKNILKNGETGVKVGLLHDGEPHEYYVSELTPGRDDFLALRKGDMIAFSLDGFDNLSQFELLQGVENYDDDRSGMNTDDERFCGLVKDIEEQYVSADKNRWVNGYAVRFSDSPATVKTYEAFARGSTPVFVIENNGAVRCGTYDDIVFGSRVFFSVNTGNVRAIAVKR